MKHFINLNDISQRTCHLLFDEVCVKALQYHGGIVSGKTVNRSYLLANTILSFVIATLLEGLEFLCEMLTVRELDSKFIFENRS